MARERGSPRGRSEIKSVNPKAGTYTLVYGLGTVRLGISDRHSLRRTRSDHVGLHGSHDDDAEGRSRRHRKLNSVQKSAGCGII